MEKESNRWSIVGWGCGADTLAHALQIITHLLSDYITEKLLLLLHCMHIVGEYLVFGIYMAEVQLFVESEKHFICIYTHETVRDQNEGEGEGEGGGVEREREGERE